MSPGGGSSAETSGRASYSIGEARLVVGCGNAALSRAVSCLMLNLAVLNGLQVKLNRNPAQVDLVSAGIVQLNRERDRPGSGIVESE